LATALESLAEVNIQSRIPNSREELGDCQALVVAARTDMAACLTGPDIARAACLGGATPLPVLWLVGQQEDPVGSAAAKVLRVPTVVWPVSLDHLANFVGKI
jgi:hypothetical protein